MARAGETPQAQFKGLAYGQNQALNDQAQMIDDSPPHDPTENFAPADEEEQFLYGPTDRPAEPLTAGAPFGPGPTFVRGAFETNHELVNRVAGEIAAGPDATPEVRAFAARVAAGE